MGPPCSDKNCNWVLGHCFKVWFFQLQKEIEKKKEKLKYGCIYREKENWDEEAEWKSDGNRGWKLKSDD